jgi:RAC serine/threonine-protein kinase/serum/glucocorticoid-regulated kinase 2
MSGIDHAGLLQKAGGKFIKQNQLRYFELRGTNLYYFKSKPATPTEEPQGCVDLTSTRITDNAAEKFSFIISGPHLAKQYTLYASSDDDKRVWMAKLSSPNTSNTSKLNTKGDSDDDAPAASGSAVAGLFGDGSKKISTDDFDVVRVIGKGSFGKVMQVKKKDTGEVFAMKEMSKEIIERENLLEHTFAEKSILQKINHPFIVKLHYAFQTKDKLYLVLDFLSGGELFFHLGQVQKFDEWRAKFYTAEIGLALGHLHSMDIIYRDLKPENAVLDKDGHVCLTDFGLAKTNVRGATSAKTFCGTPEYLAPEFLIGVGHGKAVDWWSLGVLLYEMLCGIPPFYSENVTEMYELILKKPLEFPPDVSPAAQDLLRKLLDRNPQARLQDVDRFKAHPFFADVNFPELYARKIRPPFVPDPAVLNFDDEFTKMKVDRLGQATTGQTHTKIAGFTYDGR